MRYLTQIQIIQQLKAGRCVEQLFPLRTEDNIAIVEYISVYKQRDDGFTVWHSVSEDIGDADYIDLYSFPDTDPDYPEGRSHRFTDIANALAFAHNELKASPEEWLGDGMIQDLYCSYKQVS